MQRSPCTATPKRLRRSADSPASKRQGPPCNAGGWLCVISPKRNNLRFTATAALQQRAETHCLLSTAPTTSGSQDAETSWFPPTATTSIRTRTEARLRPSAAARPSSTTPKRHARGPSCKATSRLKLSAETLCPRQQRRPGVAQHPTGPKACQIPGGSRCPPHLVTLPKQ